MGKNHLKKLVIIFCGLIPLLALGTVSTINSNGTTLDSTNLSICEDSYEPNDTSGTAYTVARSTTAIYNLEQEDDDWFKIYLYAGEDLDVDIYFSDALGDTDLALYSPSLVLLDSSTSTTDNEYCSITSVSTTGYYYIVAYLGPNTGYYSMYLDITTPDCTLTVTTPTSTTSWQRGTSHYIYWTDNTWCGSYVNIKLYQSGVYHSTIATAESNDGSYYWTIPSSLTTGDIYQIRVEDYYPPYDYDYSTAYFNVYAACSLTVTTPSSSTSWQRGSSHYIYWSSSGSCSSYVNIELYQSGYYYSTIASATSNDGSYYWTVPSSLTTGDIYQIRVEDYSYPSSYYDYSTAYFNVYAATCYITVTTPSSSTSWEAGSSQYIYWTSSGCSSYVTIELYKDGYYYSTITSSTSNDGSYYWTLPSSLPAGNYYEIKIEDYYDYTDYDYSSYFSITTPVPGFTWGFALLGLIMFLSMIKIMLRKERNPHLFSP